MRKEWIKPELEIVQIQLTEAATHNGPYTDGNYVPGQGTDVPRFTS